MSAASASPRQDARPGDSGPRGRAGARGPSAAAGWARARHPRALRRLEAGEGRAPRPTRGSGGARALRPGERGRRGAAADQHRSAPGVGAAVRTPCQRAPHRRRLVDPRFGQPEDETSSGYRESIASRHRPRRSSTTVARDLIEPARAARCRRGGPGSPRRSIPRADGHHVRRVAVVRERDPFAACGGSHERGEVGPARPRRHAGAEHDEPAIGRDSIQEPAESLAERPRPRVALDDRDLRAKPRETPDEPLRRCQPHRRQGLFQRTGRGSRRRDGRVRTTARGIGRLSHTHREVVVPRTRAYVGLGSNLGDARRRWRTRSHALDDLPRMRVVGVSRLYATEPVGVTDQPEFRNAVVAFDVPALPDPGALGAARRAQGARARVRPPAACALGPRELDLDLLVFGRAGRRHRASRGGAIDRGGSTRRRPQGSSRCRTRRRERACSSSRRWPTSPRASCRRAGARPSTMAAARRERRGGR